MSVEQAAERLRRWREISETSERHGHIYASLADGGSSRHADEQAVLDAWFDPRPLSEEILRASGWKPANADTVWYHGFTRVFIKVELHGYYARIGSWKLCRIRNVGDLRRLLSALHIGCPVVVPESEVSNG